MTEVASFNAILVRAFASMPLIPTNEVRVGKSSQVTQRSHVSASEDESNIARIIPSFSLLANPFSLLVGINDQCRGP
jgi:hypothetical protein